MSTSFSHYEAGVPRHCPVGWIMRAGASNQRWRRVEKPKEAPHWETWVELVEHPEIGAWRFDEEGAGSRRVWIEVPHAPSP